MINITENSFKDPSGNTYIKSNCVYRVVNNLYREEFIEFSNSEFYKLLVNKKYVLPFYDLKDDESGNLVFYTNKIYPISYPYEWSISQLKDAALLTLKIQNLALKNGYTLKDATPFNIVFDGCKPYFIDFFSFEKQTNKPWVAYDQFIKMFYLPIVYRKYFYINLNKYLISDIDGFEIMDIVNTLPIKSYFNFSIFSILILPYKLLSFNKKTKQKKEYKIDVENQIKLVNFLFDSILNLNIKNKLSRWNDYYSNTIHEGDYLELKNEIITNWLNIYDSTNELGVDFGTNNGYFANLLSTKFNKVLAIDLDFDAIDNLYINTKKDNNNKILAVQSYMHNLSPAIGWDNKERLSLVERISANLSLVLALTHHLRITNNVPFSLQAKFFAKLTEFIIIEFIEKSDSKVQELLSSKDDVYSDYNSANFESSFEIFFEIIKTQKIGNYNRHLYYMKRKYDK